MDINKLLEFQDRRQELQVELDVLEKKYLESFSSEDPLHFQSCANQYILALREYKIFVEEFWGYSDGE